MIHAPPAPVAGRDRSIARFDLRFEDVAQDGRLRLDALPTALGQAVWQSLLEQREAMRAWRNDGIVPILTRYVMSATPGPFSIAQPLEASGCFELAHTRAAGGAVDRLFLNTWADVFGPIGRTYPPRPERAGERTRAGTIFAEYVFTRPFAPPDQRRVTRFDVPGFAPVPEAHYTPRPHAEVLPIPSDATWLDADWVFDSCPLALGYTHTDSNQHVNSLVHLHAFEEAALRRFTALGRSTMVLARAVEVAFRKPVFAGQQVRAVTRAFESAGSLGAVGAIVPFEMNAAAETALAKPYATLCMSFDP